MKIGYRNALGFLLITIFVSILWFVSRYKDQYRDTIRVDIQWQNIPADVMNTDQKLAIEVPLVIQSNGYQLIWANLKGRSLALDFDQNTFTRNDSVFFNPTLFRDQIEAALTSNFKVVQVANKDYHLPVQHFSTKKVPLLIEPKLKFQSNFINLGAPKVSTDSVLLTGDNQQIDTMDVLKLSPKAVTIADTLTRIKYQLSEGYVNVKTIPEVATLTIRAAQVTEGTFRLPIRLLNKDANVVKIIPDRLELTYTTTVADFLEVGPEDFLVTVDYSKVTDNNQSLVPEIVVENERVLDYRIDPKQIQILTIK